METTLGQSKVSLFIKRIFYTFLSGLLILLIPACSKDSETTTNTESKAHLTVRMTDAPGAYDAVMIDLRRVEIIQEGGEIIELNTNAGIYNLLEFSNGLDTLIAVAELDTCTISQIRLILGENNSVVVDSISYPLSTPSASQSGLKLQVHQKFEAGISYNILLDFDANQSIVAKGNGGYLLKPVIRTINTAVSGAISGSITPAGLMAAITATIDTVSYSTAANENGYFMIKGLPAGSYNVTITPELPLFAITINGVAVTVGEVTNIGITGF